MDSQIQSGVSAKAQKTAARYLGDMSGYEAKRSGQAKWDGEDQKVREFLSDLPSETEILDVPVGTGRFLPFYQSKGFNILGLDISDAMLTEARKQAHHGPGATVQLRKASIFELGVKDDTFDAVVCCRFLNLIEAEDVKKALAELQRVSKSRVIFTLRVRQKNPTGRYHSAYPVSLVEESLMPGWRIERNDPVHEEDYRMIELRCGATG